MGYTLSAKIKNKNSSMTPDDIDLVSFGIRKGEEIEGFKPTSVITNFESLSGKYKGMMARDAKTRGARSKKPLTFSWFPRSDIKPVFRNLTGRSLNITITIIDNDTKFSWNVVFDDVVLFAGKPDPKIFPPDNYKRTDERFDGTFLTFEPDPK